MASRAARLARHVAKRWGWYASPRLLLHCWRGRRANYAQARYQGYRGAMPRTPWGAVFVWAVCMGALFGKPRGPQPQGAMPSKWGMWCRWRPSA